MKLDKRAVVLAAAAVAIAVILGYWAGAVAGVTAALAGLFSAAVLQVAVNRQDQASGRRAALAEADASFAPAIVTAPPIDLAEGDDDGGGVARYLRPEAEVVRFWPRPELDELVQWVVSDARLAVRLVTGAGGSGKTRLARQLGEKVTDLGCRAWWVPAGRETEAVQAAGQARVPVLMVVDYAETRTALPGMLAAAADDASGSNLRILLLARSAGEWWQQLHDSSPYAVSELIAAAKPIQLGPITETSRQEDVFTEALAAFAALRGIPCPEAELRLADRDAVVLVVHAAALLAVLDAEAALSSSTGGQTTDDVLSRLLGHERRYWQQSLARRLVAPLDSDVIESAVAAGCLIGADDQESALDLLAAIPDLADAQLRGTVARWLHDLYPVPGTADSQEWIGQLRPDLIAERLVVTVLAKHPELISRIFTSLDGIRALRSLTVLARAALTQPAALGQVRRALEAGPGRLVVPALAVTTETNPDLASVIMQMLAAGTIPADGLKAIGEAIPYPSTALAEVGAAVAHALATAATTDGARARWLVSLSNRLSGLGRWEEALAVIGEAVSIYRGLAAARPDAFLPDLATSLNNQSNFLSGLGRREEALAVIEEAVSIRRGLAAARPDVFQRHLATSLNNLADVLRALGRTREATAAQAEADGITGREQ